MTSPEEKAEIVVRDFVTSVVLFHDSIGRLLGLSAADRKCLDFISRGPVTPGDIARYTGLTTGAVTGLIDRLSSAGYVYRTPDADDRRRVLVAVAETGPFQEIRASVFEALGSDMKRVAAGYTPNQVSAILDFMDKSREVLLDHTRRLEGRDVAPPAPAAGPPARPAATRRNA